MSRFANPKKAQTWLDGDAFRAPSGTPIPDLKSIADFDPDPDKGLTSTVSGNDVDWDAYGGIEAGVDFTPEQSITDKEVWNKRGSVYDSFAGIRKDGGSFIAVDDNAATIKTRLRGGKIVKRGSLYIEEVGDEEEIALLYLFRRGTTKARGIYIPRAVLASPPSPGRFNGQDLDGWTFDWKYLDAPQPFTLNAPPSGVSVEDGDASGETPAP